MIDKPGQISDGSGQRGASRPKSPKSRPAQPEPNRLACSCGTSLREWEVRRRLTSCLDCRAARRADQAQRPCHDCGRKGRISKAAFRKSNYLCRACYATRVRLRRHEKHGEPQKKITVESIIFDAISRYGLPTTTNEIARMTGIPRRRVSPRISEMVSSGILRHTGGRIRYGNGGPSFCFELASHAERRQAISRNIAHQQALVEPGAREHSKATQAEVML